MELNYILSSVAKINFETDKRYHISQKEWLNLWQDVTGIDEITQVHVQKIKQNNNKELYEMAKYSGKDSDYLINQKVFDIFYKSLKGKQILVYSGLFKEARKKLKNGDLYYLKEVDPTDLNVFKFPLYSYKAFGTKSKFRYFFRNLPLQELKNGITF